MSMVVAFTITPWLALPRCSSSDVRRGSTRQRAPTTATDVDAPTGFYRARCWRRCSTRPRRRVGCSSAIGVAARRSALLLAVIARGAAQDAALRQQERVRSCVLDLPRGHDAGATPTRSRAISKRVLATRARGDATSRPTSGSARRWTSTAWCGTTTCAAAATWRTSASTWCPRSEREQQRTRSRCACGRELERDRGARTARDIEDRRVAARPAGARRRSWPRSTGAPSRPYDDLRRRRAARRARACAASRGVVDVDDTVEADARSGCVFVTDQEKAALSGCRRRRTSRTRWRSRSAGSMRASLHEPGEREPARRSGCGSRAPTARAWTRAR